MNIKTRQLLSLLLVLSVLFGGLIPSTTAYASGINAPGNTSIKAVLNSEAYRFSITVPASVLIHVDPDGIVTTTPEHLPIVNNAVAPMYVHSISVTPNDGWALDPITTDYSDFKFNRKNYWLSFNGLDPSSGPISLTTPIYGSETLSLVLSADVAPQKTAIDSFDIGEVVIILDWEMNEDAQDPVLPDPSSFYVKGSIYEGLGRYEVFIGFTESGTYHIALVPPNDPAPASPEAATIKTSLYLEASETGTTTLGELVDFGVESHDLTDADIYVWLETEDGYEGPLKDMVRTAGDTGSNGEMPGHYELAEDSEWSGDADGEFRYIGSKPYVAVPHEIKGVPVTSYKDMFRGTDVRGVYSDNSDITSMNGMLREAHNLEEVLLETSNVQDMGLMFAKIDTDTLDLSNLETTGVNSFLNMFWDAKISELIVPNFDTTSTEDLSQMFMSAVIGVLDLSSFDITDTAKLDMMFYNVTTSPIGYAKTQADADRLNSSLMKPEGLTFIVRGNEPDVPDYDNPDFDPEDYPEDYEMTKNSEWEVFTPYWPVYLGSSDYPIIPPTINGTKLTGIDNAFGAGHGHIIKGVYVDNLDITSADNMFKDNKSTSIDLQYINIPNVTNVSSMFEGTSAETLDLSTWDVSKIRQANKMFKNTAASNIVLSGLDFKELNQSGEMFAGVNVDTLAIKGITMGAKNMFEGATINTLDLSEFVFTLPTSPHTVESLYTDIFKGATIGTLYVRDRDQAELINQTPSKPANLNPIIKGQTALPEGYVLALDRDFDDANKFIYQYSDSTRGEAIQNYYPNNNMAYGYRHNKFVLPHTINGEILTSYSFMFDNNYYAGHEVRLPKQFYSDNSAITDTSYMFKDYPTATLTVDLDTSNVENMQSMFENTKVINLDLSALDTDNVTDVSSMFKDSRAGTIDISSFNLSSAYVNIYDLFNGAEATTVYVSSQDDIDYIQSNGGTVPETINFIIK